MAKGVNDAGRGLNLVIVGNGKEILKTAHFDTYEEGDCFYLSLTVNNIQCNSFFIAFFVCL